jgi:hypothetical protein
MKLGNRMAKDSFEKAGQAFFGTAESTVVENLPVRPVTDTLRSAAATVRQNRQSSIPDTVQNCTDLLDAAFYIAVLRVSAHGRNREHSEKSDMATTVPDRANNTRPV